MTATVALFGWIVVVGLLALSITQWVGFDQWRPVAVLQAMSPYLLAVAAPVGVVAAATGRWAMALVSLAPLLTLAWLFVPAVRARRAPGADAHTVTIFFGNLLALNTKVSQVMQTVAATDADVLVLTEFTPEMHVDLVQRCGDRYPLRIEDVRPNPAGIAIWSRLPLRGAMVPLSDRPCIDAFVDVHDTSVRLIGVHTEPPTMRARAWSRELRDIGDLAVGADLVVGDFNAARWHPSFRRLLARGWSTAHEWLGRWSSNSWAHEGRAFPLFVRIDHALLGPRVQPVRVTEVPLPGSDHLGFVLTVSVPR